MSGEQQMSVDHPFDNILRAAERALDDVVAPSLDPANPLAREQLRLVIRFLDLVRRRAAFVAERQRAELGFALQRAQAVAPHVHRCPAEVSDGLEAARREAAQLLDVPAGIDVMQRSARRLDALVTCVVRCAAGFEADAREAVERAVISASRSSLDLHRAWHAPLGLDPERATVPSLRAVLGASS